MRVSMSWCLPRGLAGRIRQLVVMSELNLIAFYGKVTSCNSHRYLSMGAEELSKEQRVLRQMRKTLE